MQDSELGHHADHTANLLQYAYDDREGKNNVVEQEHVYGNYDDNGYKKELLRLIKPVSV